MTRPRSASDVDSDGLGFGFGARVWDVALFAGKNGFVPGGAHDHHSRHLGQAGGAVQTRQRPLQLRTRRERGQQGVLRTSLLVFVRRGLARLRPFPPGRVLRLLRDDDEGVRSACQTGHHLAVLGGLLHLDELVVPSR